MNKSLSSRQQLQLLRKIPKSGEINLSFDNMEHAHKTVAVLATPKRPSNQHAQQGRSDGSVSSFASLSLSSFIAAVVAMGRRGKATARPRNADGSFAPVRSSAPTTPPASSFPPEPRSRSSSLSLLPGERENGETRVTPVRSTNRKRAAPTRHSRPDRLRKICMRCANASSAAACTSATADTPCEKAKSLTHQQTTAKAQHSSPPPCRT